jgi:hypothetical protein
MHAIGLALAGVLVLAGPIAAHAGPLEGKGAMPPAGPRSAIVQIGDGSGSGWRHPAAGSWGGGQQFGAGRGAPPNGGWCPPHSANRFFGGWGPYGWRGVPTYWVWGPSGGAFDYPDLLGQQP